MKRILTILAAVSLCLALGGFAQADLVKNGGFETGDFSEWTRSGDPAYTYVNGNDPHSGDYAAVFGPQDGLGYISQNLATSAGESYYITFWLGNAGLPSNQFVVQWDGKTIFDITDVGYQVYTQYNFTEVASGTSTNLTFGFQHTPVFWYFDDISVNAVPVPPAAWLLGSGLLGLIGLRRFRR